MGRLFIKMRIIVLMGTLLGVAQLAAGITTQDVGCNFLAGNYTGLYTEHMTLHMPLNLTLEFDGRQFSGGKMTYLGVKWLIDDLRCSPGSPASNISFNVIYPNSTWPLPL